MTLLFAAFLPDRDINLNSAFNIWLRCEVDLPFRCITQHPSFRRICLHSYELENAIMGFSQVCGMRAAREMNNMYVHKKYIYLPMLFGFCQ